MQCFTKKLSFSLGGLARQGALRPLMEKIGCSVTLLVAVLFFSTGAHAATWYVCGSASSCNSGMGSPSGWSTGSDSNTGGSKSAPFATLSKAYSKMASGDTLIVGNGTYTGTKNATVTSGMYNGGSLPPSGTSGAYTTVEAENTGGVIFDGQNTSNQSMCFLWGSSVKYLAFQGLVWCRSGAGVEAVAEVDYGANHIKFLQCGAYDASAGNSVDFEAHGASYILFEGCYAYGLGRYKFLSYGGSQYLIFRNCVGRQDAVDNGGTTNPMAVFSMYDSNDILVQNCIAIDSNDPSSYVNGIGQYGGCFSVFTTDSSSNDVTYTNSVCLNSTIGAGVIANNNPATNITYYNDVFWGVQTASGSSGRMPIFFSRAQSGVFTGLTFGNGVDTNSMAQPVFGWDSGSNSLHNSIFTVNTLYKSSTGLVQNWWGGGTLSEGYNGYYGNTAATPTLGSGDGTTNPSLKWLTLSCTNNLPSQWSGISGSTSMCGAGQGGANIGANLIYQQGKSGTLWGDTGYNLPQDGTNGQATVLMWPFPNEAAIQARMASYSNSTYGVTGTRGFCAGYNTTTDTPGKTSWGEPLTLTRYIWEYLGNQIPGSIYQTLGAVTAVNLVYTVTAGAGTGGSIAMNPSNGNVVSGNSVTFTITPNSGHTFSGLSVNGVAVTATAAGNGTYTYTIPSVQEYYTVQATFN